MFGVFLRYDSSLKGSVVFVKRWMILKINSFNRINWKIPELVTWFVGKLSELNRFMLQRVLGISYTGPASVTPDTSSSDIVIDSLSSERKK